MNKSPGARLFGVFEKWRMFLLGLVVVSIAFMYVALSMPMGFAVFLGFAGIVSIWPPLFQEDPTKMSYIAGTKAYKQATFIHAYKMHIVQTPGMPFAPALSPSIMGFGPPDEDADHDLQAGLMPATRLSSYWALTLALALGSIEFFTSQFVVFSIWAGYHLPWWIMMPLSVVGYFILIQCVLHTKRLQGSPDELMGIEPKPPIMLNKVFMDVSVKDVLIASLVPGAIAGAFILSVMFAVGAPLWLKILLPLMVMLTLAMYLATKKMSGAYLTAWQERADARMFWDGTWAFKKDEVPTLISEDEIPTLEDFQNYVQPNDPEAQYEPLLKISTFAYPPSTHFVNFQGLEDKIIGSLGVDKCSISPIGLADEMGAEVPGTIGNFGFRVWQPVTPMIPDILDPDMDTWMREFICRAVIIPILSSIKGIGPCTFHSVIMMTRPTSPQTIVEVRLVPQSSGVNVKSFLDHLEEIQRKLNVPWARARYQPGTSFIQLYIGHFPNMKQMTFINPAMMVRQTLDEIEWQYVFHSSGFRNTPKLKMRKPSTPLIDKLVFDLPDGLTFEVVKESLDKLKSTSLNEFMEIDRGDTTEQAKKTEHQRIMEESKQSAQFTIVAAKNDPLKRVFMFNEYADQLLRERTPGMEQMSWSPGIAADDSICWYDMANPSEEPHLLFAGSSGSGKSVVVNSMILQLSHNNGPGELNFWMTEPKNEMQVFQDLDVVTNFLDMFAEGSFFENMEQMMGRLVVEMDRRNKAFISHPKQPKKLSKAREIARNESKRNGTKLEDHPLYMPYIVCIIEECATIFAEAIGDDKEPQKAIIAHCTEIARKARSAGIYLCAATQYPTNASIPSTIRQQMSRIGLKCQNSLASTVVIGEPGLEQMTIKGTGKMKVGSEYRTFRGFLVMDGDPDAGEANDIFTTLANIPTKNSKKPSSPEEIKKRFKAPDLSETLYGRWSARGGETALAEIVAGDRPDYDNSEGNTKIKPRMRKASSKPAAGKKTVAKKAASRKPPTQKSTD